MAQQTTSRTVLIFSRPIQVLHGDEHNHAQRYKNSSKLMSVFITFFLKATKFTDKIHRNGDWNNFFGLHQVLHNALFSILSAVFAQVLQVAQEHFQLAHLAEEPIFCYGLFAVYFTQNFTLFRKNTKKKGRKQNVVTTWFLAERGGFEPPNRFRRLHAFQACLFSHSSTFPFRNLLQR